MPIAQKQVVGEIAVALVSLEVYESGIGILRWRFSYDKSLFQDRGEHGDLTPEPDFVIRDDSGRVLLWSPRSSGGGGGEESASVEVSDLPEAGELEVEVARMVAGAWAEEEAETSYDGPWTFRFTI